MNQDKPSFEYTFDGVKVSLESSTSKLTMEQAREMLIQAYPERKLDIYRGLREVIRPDTAA